MANDGAKMKLWETSFDSHEGRKRNKRAMRKFALSNNTHSRKYKHNGKKLRVQPEKIIAPTYLDLYNPKNHDKLIIFIKDIELQSKIKSSAPIKKVYICFRNTIHIGAAAGLWMLSKMESLRCIYPQITYIVTRPPVTVRNNNKERHYTVESVLNRIGFYEALGLPTRPMKKEPLVNCWEVIRGDLVEATEVGRLLEEISAKIRVNYDGMFRPLIEAMANSVEHAYREDLYKSTRNAIKHKWWCFAALMDNRLVILICDLGVGIPNTLKLTQGEGFLSKIIEILGKPLSCDGDHIKASLQVKRTRTKLGYRGKGGADLQSIIESYKESQLRIISNYGNYKYTNRKSVVKPETIWDGAESIGGTIVEWSIPLQTIDEGHHA